MHASVHLFSMVSITVRRIHVSLHHFVAETDQRSSSYIDSNLSPLENAIWLALILDGCRSAYMMIMILTRSRSHA